MAGWARRALAAALLDAGAYEEIEADRGADLQAFAVVVLSGVATGIGSLAYSGAAGILWHTLVAVVAWYVWAWITCLVGTRLLPAPGTVADHGELLRTIGFSSAPGTLRVLMVVPWLAQPVLVLTTLWMLGAMVVAVRQALDFTSTLQALAVCALGFPIYVLSILASLALLGPWPG